MYNYGANDLDKILLKELPLKVGYNVYRLDQVISSNNKKNAILLEDVSVFTKSSDSNSFYYYEPNHYDMYRDQDSYRNKYAILRRVENLEVAVFFLQKQVESFKLSIKYNSDGYKNVQVFNTTIQIKINPRTIKLLSISFIAI